MPALDRRYSLYKFIIKSCIAQPLASIYIKFKAQQGMEFTLQVSLAFNFKSIRLGMKSFSQSFTQFFR